MKKEADCIRKDCLSVLKKSIGAIKDNDTKKLKELSDQTIHNSSIFQDDCSTSTAIITYALAKIFERNKYRRYNKWDQFVMEIVRSLHKAIKHLDNGNLKGYKINTKEIIRIIAKLENEVGSFITEVIVQAKIKKGSKIYEHGISAAQVAEILGISRWELMEYIGNTRTEDKKELTTKTAKERLKVIKKLFQK